MFLAVSDAVQEPVEVEQRLYCRHAHKQRALQPPSCLPGKRGELLVVGRQAGSHRYDRVVSIVVDVVVEEDGVVSVDICSDTSRSPITTQKEQKQTVIHTQWRCDHPYATINNQDLKKSCFDSSVSMRNVFFTFGRERRGRGGGKGVKSGRRR
mmetsp:Transcript_20241/g.40159  ORF Transcript_20241/g.40159 Transcript_20241/m.40159 type:complete len:153 (+) Transcript_20241:233-691(+)